MRAALQRDGRRVLEQLYNDRALFPDEEAPRALEILYRGRPRQVQTLFGQVRLLRNYYYHRASGHGHCPLDDQLQLEGGYTPAVARLMCRAATHSPSYDEAAADLRVYAQLDFDPRDLGRLVTALSPLLREARDSLEPAPPPPGTPRSIPVLYVSGDGTGVPMRREALEGRTGKQEDGTARTREVKLGCVFTQSVLDEEGQPIRDPASTSYVGTFQGCREAGILLRQEAWRRGLGRADQVVYLGDGAAWVWENCRLNFPDAVEILDFYHASEHVGALARALHDTDPIRAASQQSQWCHSMRESSPEAFLPEVQTLLESNPHWSQDKRDAIQTEVNYLQTHAARTRYGEFRAKGYFIGSGVIEAGCKTVVGRRFKQSGMFWSEHGAEDLLSLRCQIIGPHFNRVWNQRSAIRLRHQQRNRRWSPSQN
ncbi:MAG: ISKra4 family transposase [Verrucomicrobiales bacterium]